MSSQVNPKYVLKSRPIGVPKPEDYSKVESPIPAIGEGELLCRTLYISLDPYARARMATEELGNVVGSPTVSQVVESRNPNFAAGDFVLGANGWQQYAVSNGTGLRKLNPEQAPVSYSLGVLGNTGMTGYFSMLEAGKPKAGETVVVSAAAGAVGSVAGQVAKIKGCRVVGITSSDAKGEAVVRELGFDACVNHTVEDLPAALASACPQGIDIYLDNVGGRVLNAVMGCLNTHARIVLVGGVSQYGAATPPAGPNPWPLVIKCATMVGFGVAEYAGRAEEFRNQMGQWLKEGKIKSLEHETVGLDNAPLAFIGMLQGRNLGKALVRVGDVPTLG